MYYICWSIAKPMNSKISHNSRNINCVSISITVQYRSSARDRISTHPPPPCFTFTRLISAKTKQVPNPPIWTIPQSRKNAKYRSLYTPTLLQPMFGLHQSCTTFFLQGVFLPWREQERSATGNILVSVTWAHMAKRLLATGRNDRPVSQSRA